MAEGHAAAAEGFLPTLGLEILERGEGRSRGRLRLDARHRNPHGVAHGAVLYAMADTGMGAALQPDLDEGESCATIEIKMVYLAPVRDGVLACETCVVQRGRRVAVLESEVRHEGRLVAKALGTFAILSRRE